MKKIILLGYMGSGKSTIGKILAKNLNLPFYDLDELIEKECQLSIPEIFKTKGEIFFRKKEHEIFKNTLDSPESFVLSLGGGTPYYANNHLFLNQNNVLSFYLKASISTLIERLENNTSNRPLLSQNSEETMSDFIAKQLFERSYFYHKAKYTINVDTKNEETVISEIMDILA